MIRLIMLRAALLALMAVAAFSAKAQDMKELRIGLLGGENTSSRLARYDAFQHLLQEKLGVSVKMYPAADYAGVMQAMAAGQVDLSEFSPSAFAGAWLDCHCIEPIVVPQEKDGTIFYISVMITRADSGITSLDQMKGHSLAWADPNSASGYLIPSATLKAAGISLVDGAYFSRTGFAGGHEQGIIAVLNRQYDAAVTWTSGQGDIAQGFTRGALRGMVDRGMLKMSDVSIIWKSGKIPNGPWGLRSALPASFKDAFTALMLDLPTSHKDIYDQIEQGTGVGYQKATLDLYQDIIALREAERRGKPVTPASPIDDPAYRLFLQRFGALRRARQTESALTVVAVLLLFVIAATWTGFSPEQIAAGLPRIGEYFGKLFSIEPDPRAGPIPVLAWAHTFGGVKQPQSIAYWFYRVNVYVALLWQTIEMAILATAMGFGAAFALSFPATHTFVGSRPVVFATRRLLEVMRTIPQVVLAFILVWPFGIGPLAGIVAIAAHTTGALGKLFVELNENADQRPVQGIRSVGGSWLTQIRYGVVPQVMPGFLSYALLRFEINVRSSTIIGFVGAGGIGQELKRVIGFNIYEEVSAICILILLIVVAIDLLSERIRHRFIGALT